ncbi:hypothetical protein CIHG_01770 [Coccidioides immitis H538.4]|uniref:Uncharacterized protein n=1 Tax=Coccidioides immitis H538.4 TaxID=396776 RepID=A0A0J8RH67_COCIT|nr:hypothetical protein CIHG_01770 [Coccidioides immitis H538.4]
MRQLTSRPAVVKSTILYRAEICRAKPRYLVMRWSKAGAPFQALSTVVDTISCSRRKRKSDVHMGLGQSEAPWSKRKRCTIASGREEEYIGSREPSHSLVILENPGKFDEGGKRSTTTRPYPSKIFVRGPMQE